MARDEYVMLMASLPALGPMLAAKHAPINWVRLQERLRLLRPDHRGQLSDISHLLVWSRLPLTRTDGALVQQARELIAHLTSPTLVGLVHERLEIRTLVVALRRRHAGHEAPIDEVDWGYGRFVQRIVLSWQEPDFGLRRRFPWLDAARECLEKEQPQGLERILLEVAWRSADRFSIGHIFDFEAVVLYVLRWHLLSRWTKYDSEAAAARCSELVADALATAPDILPDLPDERASS